VLDFHTLAGTPANEADNSGYREIGEQEGFIVAWPQGIDAAWNIGTCCTTSRDVDDVGFARALVKQLQTEACIDAKRIYATGVAMGAGMAYHLACNAADLVAGVAPSAFDLLQESEQPCQPARPVTEISFRGTADSLVPYDGGAVQAPNGVATIDFLGAVGTFQRWAELDQCVGSPSAEDSNGCSTYSNCAGGVEVTLCTTQGGGMAWGPADIGWSMLQRHPMP
jgi:polyhydroxybutyrate depolymerase